MDPAEMKKAEQRRRRGFSEKQGGGKF